MINRGRAAVATEKKDPVAVGTRGVGDLAHAPEKERSPIVAGVVWDLAATVWRQAEGSKWDERRSR